MFNNKEKWQEFTDWKGWKWVYYFTIFATLALPTYAVGYAIVFFLCENCLSSHSDYGNRIAILSLIKMTVLCLVIFVSVIKPKIRYFYKIFLGPTIIVFYIFLSPYIFMLESSIFRKIDPPIIIIPKSPN
jgi:hypothetical protein